MLYNLKNKRHRENFKNRAKKMLDGSERVELTKKREARSLNQNNYFHLALSLGAIELGYTLAEMKHAMKVHICPQIFVYCKQGVDFVRSSADLDTKEMTQVIEKFRNRMAKNNIYIPEPDEHEKLEALEAEVQKHYSHL